MSVTARLLPPVLALALVSCGGPTAPVVGPEPTELPPPPRAAAPASAPATRKGEIRRGELAAFLDQGMPAFIHHVVVERFPRRRSHRFRGWQIAEFFPGDPRFAQADIRPGDVVLRVNGRLIERPDQFAEIWSSLRRARELVVDAERDGKPRQLRWRIVD
jgi:S1-C subfamily serine protease